jgi:hypothetical protein
MPKDVFGKHTLKLKFIFIKTVANQTKPQVFDPVLT